MSIRVLLADDHDVVVEGLKLLLAPHTDMEVVGVAANGRDAVDLAARLAPDVVVIDVTMPELNGIDAVREIRRRAPEAEILGLSMHAARQVVVDMLRAGASGYLLKAGSARLLTDAIRTVMTGQTFLSPELAEAIPADLLRRTAARADERALSEREREVLKLVAEGKSSKEIAEALYVTTKTIGWHRQSIMDKLNLRSVAELTKYAVRTGLTTLNE